MKKLTLLSILIFAVITVTAQVIHVPGDKATIQEGINSAEDGEMVLVEEGIYYENINFKGKAITVASEFILDGDTNHISNTIIDGSQSNDPYNGSVVTFDSGEDTNSVLCGFTITGGTGTETPQFNAKSGGGIYCYPAGCKIMNNYIEYNSVNTEGEGYGGAIMADHVDEGLVIILNNKIRYNQVNAEGPYAYGAGIALFGSASVIGNEIIGNSAVAYNGKATGGIACFGGFFTPEPKEILIAENIVVANSAHSFLENYEGAFGGGMIVMDYYGLIKNNTVLNNEIGATYQCYGAGIYLQGNSDELIIENNSIMGNYFIEGTCFGGGIGVVYGEASLINNEVSNNKATFGGGVFVWSNYTNNNVPITNNTIVGNESESYGPGLYVKASNVELKNSILWDNTSLFSGSIYETESSLEVSYSDIEGGWPGDGNIDSIPIFVGAGEFPFQINDISPCIDAGTPNTTGLNLPELDLAGEVRIDNERVDMGAFEWNWMVEVDEIVTTTQQNEIVNYPNPFSVSTTIEYNLMQSSNVQLSIYNHLGEMITTLAGWQLSGKHQYRWDAKGLPIGVYYFTLFMDDEVVIRKMVKVD